MFAFENLSVGMLCIHVYIYYYAYIYYLQLLILYAHYSSVPFMCVASATHSSFVHHVSWYVDLTE